VSLGDSGKLIPAGLWQGGMASFVADQFPGITFNAAEPEYR
jgi:hypothetical protein